MTVGPAFADQLAGALRQADVAAIEASGYRLASAIAVVGVSRAARLPVMTCALMLGRKPKSLAQLERPSALQRLGIAAAEAAAAAYLRGPEPEPEPEPAPQPQPEPPAAEAPPPKITAQEPPRPVPVAKPPVSARTPRPRPAPRAQRAGGVVVRLQPLTPARQRYAGWFLGAGWSLREAAWLFDLDPERLAEAVSA